MACSSRPAKKPRLSNDTNDLPVSPHSPVIEALAPEAADGTSFEAAIVLEEDIDGMDSSYRQQFDIDNDLPVWSDAIRSKYCLPLEVLISCRDAISQHLAVSLNDQQHWLHKYLDDEDFFASFGFLLRDLLSSAEVVDPVECGAREDAERAVVGLYSSAAILCSRIVCLLPDLIKSALRRDSAQSPKPHERPVPLLVYLDVLALLTASDTAATEFFASSFGLSAKGLANCLRPTPVMVQSLVKTFDLLAHDSRAIKNSWYAIVSMATFMSTSCQTLGLDMLLDFIVLITDVVIPVLCGKHPRMLPPRLHACICQVGANLLLELTLKTPNLPLLYRSVIESPADALRESPAHVPPEQLLQMCQGDRTLLATLFMLSWRAQTLTKYIIGSEIMDVRQIGVKQLGSMLTDQYKEFDGQPQHVVLQLLARFLRMNELTKFLFGPSSHAMLLKESQLIVEYLAATNSYTDREADIIWEAVTSAAETEFIQATQHILVRMSYYFEYDHIFYMLRKYNTLPVEKVTVASFELLTALFSRLHDTKDHNTSIALLCVDILCHFITEKPNGVLLELQNRALGELRRIYLNSTFAERISLYEYVAPKVSAPSSSMDMPAVIMNMLLALARFSEDEAPKVLAMLPFSAALQHMKAPTLPRSAANVAVRMELSIRLAVLTVDVLGQMPNSELNELWEQSVGVDAVGDKEIAWRLLHGLSRDPKVKPVLQHCLEHSVAQLPIAAATPTLVLILKQQIDETLHEPSVYQTLLEKPAWMQLVKLAVGSSTVVGQASQDTLCNILFHENHVHAIEAQCLFAKQIMKQAGTCRLGSETSRQDRSSDFNRLVLLLEKLIITARSIPFPTNSPPEINLIGDSDSAHKQHERSEGLSEDHDPMSCIRFSIEICGPARQLRLMATAYSYTTIDLVTKALVAHTGTASSCMMLDGQIVPLEDVSSRTLTDLKVRNATTLVIRPRYTADDDLDLALPPLNPLEQTILNEYDRLETLLRDPELAPDAYRFICGLRRPAQARRRLARQGGVDEHFPADHPYWCRYTIQMLAEEQAIHKSLGIQDAAVFKRDTGLLMSFISSSNSDEDLLFMAISTLKDIFLNDPAVSIISTSSLELKLQTLVTTWCEMLPTAGPSTLPLVSYSLLMRLYQDDFSFWERSSQNLQWLRTHNRLLLYINGSGDAEFAVPMLHTCHNTDLNAPKQFYLMVLAEVMPTAVECRRLANGLVELFQSCIVHLSDKTESNIRDVLDDTIRILFRHDHVESFQFSGPDMVVLGLLRMTSTLVDVLKSFKKPLGLGQLAVHIAKSFLLPSLQDPENTPLLADVSRTLACELIKQVTESDETRETLMDYIMAMIEEIPGFAIDPQLTETYPGCKDLSWTRSFSAFSGLKNYNLTCYVNSLLQQLFANQDFRKFVLMVPLCDIDKQKFLAIVQILFASMQNSCAPIQHTEELLEQLAISKNEQDDAHQFYANVMSALEHSMPDEGHRARFNEFFSGEQVTQIRGECGHVSSRIETFIDIPVVVRNKERLTDSLNGFVQGEPLEGSDKYRCSACTKDEDGSLVNAVRRTCLNKLPQNLTFTLKRFSYNVATGEDDKVNDRFDFPLEIDMMPYKLETLEKRQDKLDGDSDVFDLVGVVVHSGSMAFGHYWTYVRTQRSGQPDAWIKLEDHWTSEVPFREVMERSLGGESEDGRERHMSAYVLLYRRRSSPEKSPTPWSETSLLDAVPTKLAYDIKMENKWRYRVKHLFDDNLGYIVSWLLSTSNPADPIKKVKLSTLYLARVSLRRRDDQAEHEKLRAELIRKIDYDLDVVRSDAFLTTANAENLIGLATKFPPQSARADILGLVLKATTILARRDESTNRSERADIPASPSFPDEEQTRGRVRDTVIRLVVNLDELEVCSGAASWHDFFDFGALMAQISREVTALMLDQGYLAWILRVVRAFWVPKLRKRLESLAPWIAKRQFPVSALLSTLPDFLAHVDLSSCDDGTAHSIGAQGVRLLDREMKELRIATEDANGNINSWLSLAIRSANLDDAHWENYWPGKLVQMLSSRQVDQDVRESLQAWLRDCFWRRPDHIEYELLWVLLFFVLFGSSEDDADRGKLLEYCIFAYGQWDGTSEDDITALKCMQRAAQVCGPTTVLQSLPRLSQWLIPPADAETRGHALEFLHWLVFEHQPISQPQNGTDDEEGGQTSLTALATMLHGTALDACRVNAVRELCKELLSGVEIGSRDGTAAPRDFGDAVQVLASSYRWLQRLVDESRGKRLLSRLGRAIVDTRETLDRLRSLLQPLRNFVASTDTPARRSAPSADMAAADTINDEVELAGEKVEEEDEGEEEKEEEEENGKEVEVDVEDPTEQAESTDSEPDSDSSTTP